MEYTQLDKTSRLVAIRGRIRDLERQYLNLHLQTEAPGLDRPVSEMNGQNLVQLEDSLAKLRAMEAELTRGT